jgi:hypothetical protein
MIGAISTKMFIGGRFKATAVISAGGIRSQMSRNISGCIRLETIREIERRIRTARSQRR